MVIKTQGGCAGNFIKKKSFKLTMVNVVHSAATFYTDFLFFIHF